MNEIFEIIRRRIKEVVLWSKSIDLYYQQDSNQAKSLGYKSPYILIEFVNMQRNILGYDQLQCTCDCIIRIIFEDYTRQQLNVMDYATDFIVKMWNFAPTNYSMLLKEEIMDISADALYVYKIIYTLNFNEDLSTLSKINASTSGISFDISLLMDSNNDDIFTGHNGTSGNTINFTSSVVYANNYIKQTFTNQYAVTAYHGWGLVPNVVLLDANNQILDGIINYIDLDTIQVTFLVLQTGNIIIQRPG